MFFFKLVLYFKKSEEEKEKMKMNKINFFTNEVTSLNVISLDSSILARVENINGFPLREMCLKNNHVFYTRLT